MIFGGFSVFGILTARRSYLDHNWQTKVRVARLVYSDVCDRINLDERDTPPFSFSGEDYDYRFGLGDYVVANVENDRGDIVAWGAAREDVAGFHVVVSNNSEEPVGGVYLRVLHPDTQEVVAPDASPMWIGTIDPDCTRRCMVYVPRDWASELTPMATIELTFTDSSGQQWRRVETEPPKEVE